MYISTQLFFAIKTSGKVIKCSFLWTRSAILSRGHSYNHICLHQPMTAENVGEEKGKEFNGRESESETENFSTINCKSVSSPVYPTILVQNPSYLLMEEKKRQVSLYLVFFLFASARPLLYTSVPLCSSFSSHTSLAEAAIAAAWRPVNHVVL